MFDHFKFNQNKKEFLAIVFEKLGTSLYEFIKDNKYLGKFYYKLITNTITNTITNNTNTILNNTYTIN